MVSRDCQGKRLDKFLAEQLPFLSRGKIQGAIEGGLVSVDGKIKKKSSFHLQPDQRISFLIEEEKKALRPFEFKVKIIYEDDDIIVVDKPSGLAVHPPSENYYQTLVNALLYLKKDLSTLNPLRPGVVHRLDKETSGVIVLAKNNLSHKNLIEQFKKRKVKKEYRAIVWGKIARDKLSLALPLSRDKRNRLKMKISFFKSKEAYTEIEAIERLKDATFLSLIPHTGRTHQIRVHLKFLGFPIVGDKKYGIKDDYKELFLHAYKLGFFHPKSGKFWEFSSALPERFKEFIREHQ